MTTPSGFVPREDSLIAAIGTEPQAVWAIDNSLTGVHVIANRFLERQVIEYELVALLTEKQTIFWKLKFGEQ